MILQIYILSSLDGKRRYCTELNYNRSCSV